MTSDRSIVCSDPVGTCSGSGTNAATRLPAETPVCGTSRHLSAIGGYPVRGSFGLLIASAGTNHEATWNPWPVLFVVVLVATSIYLWQCVFRPFVPCQWCEESGCRQKWVFKGTKQCRHCKGEGQRLVLGRALWARSQARRKRAAKARSEL